MLLAACMAIEDKMTPELVEYLEDNCGQKIVRPWSPPPDHKHEEFLHYISGNLSSFGISAVRDVFREVRLAVGKDVIGDSDLVILTDSGICLLEAKVLSGNSVRIGADAKHEMRMQLFKSYEFFLKKFGLAAGRCIATYRQKGYVMHNDVDPTSRVLEREFARHHPRVYGMLDMMGQNA